MTEHAPPGYHYQNGPRPLLTYIARFLALACNMRHVGTLPCGSIIVADATCPSGGDWWTIGDNGGELNVRKINDPYSIRSVPYIQGHKPAPIGRVVSFCASVMQGSEIELWTTSTMDDLTLTDFQPWNS
jgi:hypothetical protein